MILWHRLFGLALTDLYHGTCYSVIPEKDLSLKQQLLDVAVIAIEAAEGPFVDLEDPPDGLEDLARHNLLTFKSFREPLNDWAMDELLGHFVNYRKQCSPPKSPLAPLSDFRLIAVSARYPERLASQVKFTKCREGVYNVVWGVREVRVVVLGHVSEDPRNALWGLFSGKMERVDAARTQYVWRCPDLSTMVGQLYANYRLEGLKMPYTVEDYKQDLVREVLESTLVEEILARLPAEERLKGLPAEERLKGLPAEEVLARFPAEERLAGLSRDQILDYLKRTGGPDGH